MTTNALRLTLALGAALAVTGAAPAQTILPDGRYLPGPRVGTIQPATFTTPHNSSLMQLYPPGTGVTYSTPRGMAGRTYATPYNGTTTYSMPQYGTTYGTPDASGVVTTGYTTVIEGATATDASGNVVPQATTSYQPGVMSGGTTTYSEVPGYGATTYSMTPSYGSSQYLPGSMPGATLLNGTTTAVTNVGTAAVTGTRRVVRRGLGLFRR